MYFFVNDYNDICNPEILENLKNALDERNYGYGFDTHSENARKLIKKAMNYEDCDIYFIPGGTGANILGSASGMRQENSVISAKTGHIEGHETGAIEATGLKIETIKTEDGKLTRTMLEDFYKNFTTEYMTVPKKVYISNTTELGTVYTKEEIEDIYDFCKSNGLYLFIDGARMAAALVSEKFGATLEDLPRMCDIFYLGGTKNGMLYGEALVIVNDDLRRNFINLQKQKGQMMAKSFVPAINFETVFSKEGGYLEGARHAHEMAKKLASGLENLGEKLYQEFQSNQVFLELEKDRTEKLKEFAAIEVNGHTEDGKDVVRFVTTYRTTEEDIDGVLEEISKI